MRPEFSSFGNTGDLQLPGLEIRHAAQFELMQVYGMRNVILPRLVRNAQFALLLLLTCTGAAAQEATRIEVYEYGLYELGPTVGEYAPPNMGYRHESVSDIRHLETTRVVPGRVGVSFGVRYRVQGNGIGLPVPLRIILKFPPQGLYSPDYRDTLHVDATETIEILGADAYSGITFDEQWEIEPGIWTFEFWSGDTKLGEEQFEVITPPVS